MKVEIVATVEEIEINLRPENPLDLAVVGEIARGSDTPAISSSGDGLVIRQRRMARTE